MRVGRTSAIEIRATRRIANCKLRTDDFRAGSDGAHPGSTTKSIRCGLYGVRRPASLAAALQKVLHPLCARSDVGVIRIRFKEILARRAIIYRTITGGGGT